MPNIGDPAPQFSAVDVLTGEIHSLSDYAGAVVMLVFSGPSWSGTCQYQAPVLEEIWQTFKYSIAQPRVQLLMVSTGAIESPQAFKDAVQQFGLTFPALLNPNQAISQSYGVTNVPTLFVVDAEQKICKRHVGAPGPHHVLYQQLYWRLTQCGAAEPSRPLLDLSRWRAILTILFGVTQDGGGLALTPGGKPIDIDPLGPIVRMPAEKRDLYTSLAISELAGSLHDGAAAGEIRAAALRSAQAAMQKVAENGSIRPPEPGMTFEAVGETREAS